MGLPYISYDSTVLLLKNPIKNAKNFQKALQNEATIFFVLTKPANFFPDSLTNMELKNEKISFLR